MLHNRHLPDWVHRIANGAIGGGLCSLAVLAWVRWLGALLWAFWLSLPVAIACWARDPRRFSLVEGCAGEVGYDELGKAGYDELDEFT